MPHCRAWALPGKAGDGPLGRLPRTDPRHPCCRGAPALPRRSTRALAFPLTHPHHPPQAKRMKAGQRAPCALHCCTLTTGSVPCHRYRRRDPCGCAAPARAGRAQWGWRPTPGRTQEEGRAGKGRAFRQESACVEGQGVCGAAGRAKCLWLSGGTWGRTRGLPQSWQRHPPHRCCRCRSCC